MAIWKPDLTGQTGPKYRKIAQAIADAVAKGELAPGTCMPPHRILAYELGISPNTTSRAYGECVQAGLLYGETGRGTFVRKAPGKENQESPADLQRAVCGPIDFSSNLPFPGACAGYLAETLKQLSRATDLQTLMDYQTGPGLAHHTAMGRTWLAGMGVPANTDQTIVTCGAQHGIWAALTAVARPGDLLLTEALTYTPVMAMASGMGLKLRPIAMDENGMNPDALEAICRSYPVRAVYLTPTIQTPTTATLDIDRRRAVAEAAKKYDFILIEDDVYGALPVQAVPPLAQRAPGHTVYISSTSKSLAPGLRVGFLHGPESLVPSISRAVKLSCWMPPPLMAEVVSRWMANGTADKLKAIQRREAAFRQAMAAQILCGHSFQADPFGFHVWLCLPDQWRCSDFCRAAADQGVRLAPGSGFALNGRYDPGAVRISLSHEPDRERVRQGLLIIASLLEANAPQNRLMI